MIPTVPSTLPDLETKVTSILAKLDALPYEAIGADLKTALATLNQTLTNVDQAIIHIDKGVTPALHSALVDFRKAIVAAERVLNNTDASLLGKDAPGQIELRDTLQELTGAARSVRVLSDYLSRHPEALLRGKGGEKH